MEKKNVQIWLDQYGEAWIKGDPERAVALFSAMATYQETPFAPPMKGHSEIQRYWQEGASDSQKDVSFSSEVWAINGEVAVAGWQAGFTRIPSGVRVALNGAFRLRFRREKDRLVCDLLEEWWHRKES